MINAGEPVMVCPYNKAHSIIQSRMQFHLAKCRLQHPRSEKVACPFNSTHIVPKVELEFHESVCGSRYLIDSFVYKVGNTRCPVEPVPMNAPLDQLAPDGEDWDSVPPCPPVLDTVQMALENKAVFVSKVGASKSVRKAHRQNERLRYQRVCEDELLRKKQASENSETAQKIQGQSSFEDPNVPSSSSAIKNQFEDPNIPSCSSAIKKQLPLEDSNVPSSSSMQKKPVIDEQKNENENKNDDFEVVTYKKNQGKKGKQAQQGIRYPPPINTNKNAKEQDVINQMSQLKISGQQSNKKKPFVEEQYSENDDIEVVRYKKNQNEKAKQAMQGVRYPLRINTNENVKEQKDLMNMNQMSQLKINGQLNNKKDINMYQTQSENGSYRRVNSSNAAPTRNAWNVTSGMGCIGYNRNNGYSRPLTMDEFPSLPVSGRGRALFLLNRYNYSPK